MGSGREPAGDGEVEALSLYEIEVDEAYDVYARYRRTCPVAHSDAHGGHWILTRYEDVRAAAKDWRTYSSADGVDLPRQEFRAQTVISSDPPLHEEFRGLFQEALNQKTLQVIEPYIVELANQLIDGFAGAGTCDLVTDYTEQLPPAVICRIVGLDAELAFEMRDVSIRLGSSFGSPDRFNAALKDFRGFVLPQIEARRRSPRDDFLTRLATQPFRGAPIADDTIVQMMIGFLLAGHESTTAGISSLLFHLLSDRARVERIQREPKLLAMAMEEALRLNAPFHQFRRTTTQTAEIAGCPLPEGAHVLLNYAAANRDPDAFSEPDSFVIDRRPNAHLAFGWGIHTCVGAPLARLEIKTAVPQLFQRLPDLALVDDPGDIHWDFMGGNLAFIRSLPARFTPPPA